jgi:TPR repeat protein
MRMKINVNLPCLSALLAAALLLSGCASQQYMGVSLKPGRADPAVQALAARASSGDKQAQLDLGIRFFQGQGMASDERRACNLFRLSASDSGGALWIYTPSPGGGAPARV